MRTVTGTKADGAGNAGREAETLMRWSRYFQFEKELTERRSRTQNSGIESPLRAWRWMRSRQRACSARSGGRGMGQFLRRDVHPLRRLPHPAMMAISDAYAARTKSINSFRTFCAALLRSVYCWTAFGRP